MILKQINEKMKDDIEMNKDEILSSYSTEIEKIMLRAFNNRLNDHILDLEKAQQEQEEMAKKYLNLLNALLYLQSKNCVNKDISFDDDKQFFEKYYGKSWGEIIK